MLLPRTPVTRGGFRQTLAVVPLLGQGIRYPGLITGGTTMKLGIFSFNTEYTMPADEMARECETRGFESLWLPEHTHIPVSRESPYPGGGKLPEEYAHMADPFIGLAAAATVTKTLKL